MKKPIKLQSVILLAALSSSSYANDSCLADLKDTTPLEVFQCFEAKLNKQQNRIVELEKLNKAQEGEIQALKLRWDLKNGLVAHYPFDGHANDVSGNGHHGIVHGDLSYVPGLLGQAASFDGVDDYIEIPDVHNFVFANESVTFSAWV